MAPLRAVTVVSHRPRTVTQVPIDSRCARCGRDVDLRRADTLKVPRGTVPNTYDLPHDEHQKQTLTALFCPGCWPPR